MEIERKWLINTIPSDLEQYPHHIIEQGYLNTTPVVRVRRQDELYILTYKGGGMMAREEYNLPLDAESYQHLVAKADGHIISKVRYVIPLDDGLKIELDHFSSPIKCQKCEQLILSASGWQFSRRFPAIHFHGKN